MKISSVFAALVCAAGAAVAGPSFTNSLTSSAGLSPDLEQTETTDAMRAIEFSALGAQFGGALAGNDGRNYIRTTATDYNTASFTAEVTADYTLGGVMFIGLGGGTIGAFGTPDWDNTDSFWLELAPGGVSNTFTFNSGPDGPAGQGLNVNGPIRIRMTYDAGAGTLQYDLDGDYAGGPFTADASSAAFDVSGLFTMGEPASIFVGGGSGVLLSDLAVNVVPAPATGLLTAVGLLAAARRRR